MASMKTEKARITVTPDQPITAKGSLYRTKRNNQSKARLQLRKDHCHSWSANNSIGFSLPDGKKQRIKSQAWVKKLILREIK
jgi:hypothetical protein